MQVSFLFQINGEKTFQEFQEDIFGLTLLAKKSIPEMFFNYLVNKAFKSIFNCFQRCTQPKTGTKESTKVLQVGVSERTSGSSTSEHCKCTTPAVEIKMWVRAQ